LGHYLSRCVSIQLRYAYHLPRESQWLPQCPPPSQPGWPRCCWPTGNLMGSAGLPDVFATSDIWWALPSCGLRPRWFYDFVYSTSTCFTSFYDFVPTTLFYEFHCHDFIPMALLLYSVNMNRVNARTAWHNRGNDHRMAPQSTSSSAESPFCFGLP